MAPRKWYRRYWAPYGRVIGYHDCTYVSVRGRSYEIRRFFRKNGQFKFFVIHGVTDGKGGVLRYQHFSSCLRALRRGTYEPKAIRKTGRRARRKPRARHVRVQ